MELLYKEVAYGWYGGEDREYARYSPNEALTWHILQWCIENGYTSYDFGGAGKPGESSGVRDFKSKFRGKLINYGRNICVHAPVRFQLSQVGYKILRAFL